MAENNRVPRNWDTLPSMVVTPVPAGFDYGRLAQAIATQAGDKQLVCLVGPRWQGPRADGLQDIELLYEFADDPQLVLMRFLAPAPGHERIIIRASFMRETASLVKVSNLYDLADRLSQLARERALHTTTAE